MQYFFLGAFGFSLGYFIATGNYFFAAICLVALFITSTRV